MRIILDRAFSPTQKLLAMTGTRDRQSSLNIQQVISQILASRQLSRQEYLHLTTALLSNYNMTDEVRRQLNSIFDNLQTGQLKFVD